MLFLVYAAQNSVCKPNVQYASPRRILDTLEAQPEDKADDSEGEAITMLIKDTAKPRRPSMLPFGTNTITAAVLLW
jgi:hypothetical protein